jgi:hypothetical protein
MKTVIMSDERWSEIRTALSLTTSGTMLLASLDKTPELPSDRELVALARSGGDPPEVFARAREYRDAGRQAAADTREALEAHVRHAYGAGVRPAVLARWFGLKPSRIHEIVAAKDAT